MVNKVADVMSEFDSNTEKGNIALVRVLESNKTAFQKVVGEDGNVDDIRSSLEEWLTKQSLNPDNTNRYCIQFFKTYKQTKSGIQADGAIHCYLQFKPGTYQPGAVGYAPAPGIPGELLQLMKENAENTKAMLSLLMAKESEEEDDDDDEPQTAIGSLMQNEQFQQLAIGALTMLTNKLMGGNNQPGAIAGIDEQMVKANQALEMLSKKDDQFGDHLLYLANLPDSQYKMLLSFIK